MPCRTDDLPPSRDEWERDKLRAAADAATQAACEACGILESSGLMPSFGPAAKWWMAHKEADARRAAKEAEFAREKEKERKRLEAEERELLARLQRKYSSARLAMPIEEDEYPGTASMSIYTGTRRR